MAGTLFHAAKFEQKQIVGSSGVTYEEVVATNDNLEVVAWTSWTQVKQDGLKYGIPLDAWPEFKEEYDLDLLWANEKTNALRLFLQSIQEVTSKSDSWFDRITSFVLAGEDVFYVY